MDCLLCVKFGPETLTRVSSFHLFFQGGSKSTLFGGRYRTRTCDHSHVKRVRYQLR